MSVLTIPSELLRLLRQYAGPRPSTKTNYDGVLKQMRRKHFFKRIRKQMDRNHVARWLDPRLFIEVRVDYSYLDSDQRRRLLAEILPELVFQEIIAGVFDD